LAFGATSLEALKMELVACVAIGIDLMRRHLKLKERTGRSCRHRDSDTRTYLKQPLIPG